MEMAQPVCVRASIRDMKRLRSGNVVTAADNWQADFVPMPKRVVKKEVNIDDDTRRKNWKLLGPILRIQRWYRRITSKRSVALLLEKRKQNHHNIWWCTAAESIQRAWRGCLARRQTRKLLLEP